MSADSINPAPTSPQAYDRYSYVENNPIIKNDPTGHCSTAGSEYPGPCGSALTENGYVDLSGSKFKSADSGIKSGTDSGGGRGKNQSTILFNFDPCSVNPKMLGCIIPDNPNINLGLGTKLETCSLTDIMCAYRNGWRNFFAAGHMVTSPLTSDLAKVTGTIYLVGWGVAHTTVIFEGAIVIVDAIISAAGVATAGCELENCQTALGTTVNGFTNHGFMRFIGDGANRTGTNSSAIVDALQSPVKTGTGIDALGRPFEMYVGENARVILNPETGMIVSVNPLSAAGTQ